MSTSESRSGGCSCGKLRYETIGEPVRVSACHCKQCQLRTGSPFGVGCYFPKERVKITQGETKTFQRSSDAGRWVRNHFCPECGNTVLWEVEVLPDALGITAGSFDDTDWLDPKLHVWTESAQKWVTLPDNVDIMQKSNIGKS